jgi:tRNA A-37 threonylcarbamoyl transferase component Bud32
MMESATLTLAGRYRLEERIAAGGAGEVWRGSDAVLARAVAVKLLRAGYLQHPETLARFRAEARHAAGVTHPGIAQVYDYGEDGQPFLVMELVDGPSLAAVLARGPMDVRTTLDVVAQVATALAAAHAAGLVHRDIKPANLLLARDRQVKITDFGIAYAAGSAPLTRTGTIIGTPAYLAPERVAGGQATAASDLYSLGIVCYECLTGTPPFTGTPVEVALAHQHGTLPPLGALVPADVTALVTALTAKDPAARPASATDAARWAATLRDALPGETHPPAGQPTAAPGQLPAAPGQSTARLTHPLSATLSGAPPGLLAGPRAGRAAQGAGQGARPERQPRRVSLKGIALALVAAAAVAGLAAWLSAGNPGPTQTSGPRAGAGTVTGPSPRLVRVSQEALLGQPVSAAQRQLRRLGMHVQVSWQHEGNQQPGTVMAVQPHGLLRPGTTVVVTGVLAPPGHGHGPGPGGKKKDNPHGGGKEGG